jgi:hypothetical protein
MNKNPPGLSWVFAFGCAGLEARQSITKMPTRASCVTLPAPQEYLPPSAHRGSDSQTLLTNAEVITMVRLHRLTSAIFARIRLRPGKFELSRSGFTRLLQSGVARTSGTLGRPLVSRAASHTEVQEVFWRRRGARSGRRNGF